MGEHRARHLRRLAALVFVLLFALTPITALAAYPPDMSGAPKVTMELAPYDKNACKLTLYGTGDLLDYMRGIGENYQCSFRYNIHFSGEREIDLHGRLRYYHYKKNGPENIQWISSILECKNITYDVQRANTDSANKMSWIIKFPGWMNFNGAVGLKTVDFTLFNAYNSRQKVSQSFQASEILTDVMLKDELVSGGSVTVEATHGIPASEAYAKITITDPDLAAGYTNSPGGKGELKPIWHILLAQGSYTWVEATIDGSKGQAQNAMDFYAGYFQLNKDESNKYNAKSTDMTDRCSYEIKGDVLTITLRTPLAFRQGLQYMYYIQVDMHGGSVSHKYKIL